MRNSNERGIALITTLLVLMLISALLVGFTTMVISDQRYRFIDRDRAQAFYAASGAIEKMTGDLGDTFFLNLAPTAALVNNIVATTSLPVIPGVAFTTLTSPETLPGSSLNGQSCSGGNSVRVIGTLGYNLSYCGDAAGNPTTIKPPTPIKTGPYEGLIALQTPYQIDVTAKTSSGGEVHLSRTIESVAIPIFQFGIFSDVDLSFSAADDFSFGGRVHTNGNLYLAEGAGSTLTISNKVTAVREVVRQRLSNGVSIDTVSQTGTVKISSSASATVALARDKGSVVDGPTSTLNEPSWHTTSLSTYNSWLRNGRTGAKPLNLPLVMPSVGGSNPDLIRRPPSTELATSILFNERLFSKPSLRVLLSDTAADITTLPTVTAGTVALEGNWNTAPPSLGGTPYGVITGDLASPALNHPPLALSPGPMKTVATGTSTANGGTITFATTATAAAFKPTFTVAGSPNIITCTGKDTSTVAPWKLIGCTGNPAMPAAAINSVLTQISPAGGSTGANAPISVALTSASTEIRFGSQAERDRFDPLPFWNMGTAASPQSIFVNCTGYTTTTYTGCSPLPANAAVVLNSAVYSNPGLSTIGGVLKIERQNADSSWTDVTMEILNYGIGWVNDGGTGCPDPTPNAILRLQRLRDNLAAGGGCNYNTNATGFKDPANWWPMALFDTREGVNRDDDYPTPGLPLTGVIYYVALDAGNLAKWFQHTVAPFATGSGNLSKKDNGGFTVYFSDRRNNRDLTDKETAEFGFEDFINPGSAAPYAPNGGTPDAGEDLNANNTLEVYGQFPSYNGVHSQVPLCTVGTYPQCGLAENVLTTAARPWTPISKALAQVNRPILFRRALMLINGTTLAPAITGLTVVSENPVYIKGDWNVNAGSWTTGVHAATAVIADAVTVLSNTWIDGNSMDSPYIAANRPRPTDNYYRVAIMSGKSRIFPKPSDVPAGSTFGTDGGAHSFLRMLEGGNDTVHYRGSMATFFYSRQAVGTFKCCGGIVYAVPVRDFTFDDDFLDPAKLPPNTPVFRDMNAVGFSQELRPGK